MAITIDWKDKIIHIPRADMTLIQSSPTEIRQLDLNLFRQTLKDLEDDVEGMTFLDTHRHNTTVTISGTILARVIEIINGYTVTFEDGQYAVNTVGANSNISEVTNVNQVSIRTANSAGLQDLTSLQAASFLGQVTIKESSSYSGNIFPTGTRQYPVNNLEDSLEIATARGIRQINIVENLTLTEGDFSDGFVFCSDLPNIGVQIDSNADISNCEFRGLTISGYQDNNNLLRECTIGDLQHVDGPVVSCGLIGPIFIEGDSLTTLYNCYSARSDIGDSGPILDFTNATNDLIVRGYLGDLQLKNITTPSTFSIDMLSGTLTIDSSVTNGTIIVQGIATIVDNSTGNTTVIDETIQTVVPRNTWGKSSSDAGTETGSIGEKIVKNLLK